MRTLRKDLETEEMVDRVRYLLRYDPTTGVLTWQSRPREDFATERGWKIFSVMYAGRVAGYQTPDGHINVKIDGRQYMAHRVAFAHYHGSCLLYTSPSPRDRG